MRAEEADVDGQGPVGTVSTAGRGSDDAAVSQIVSWYRLHARDLPWRRPGTSPWAILVSEVMSQQTPVPIRENKLLG